MDTKAALEEETIQLQTNKDNNINDNNDNTTKTTNLTITKEEEEEKAAATTKTTPPTTPNSIIKTKSITITIPNINHTTTTTTIPNDGDGDLTNAVHLNISPNTPLAAAAPTATVQTPLTPLTPTTPTTPTSSVYSAQPSTSRQLFKQAAAEHGGEESWTLLQHELSHNAQTQQQQQHNLRSASSTLDASISRNPSTAGKHEKKIGHRRVDEGGEVTYKKIQSKQIMGSIQLGIQHTVGSLASKPKRDLLMNDFWEMETISFPPDGSSLTPAHHYNDFRFKVYAPIAFRYFRDLFGIAPDDFLMSMCASPLRELSNPGASGSLFYLTDDDEFIIKTVQKKECEFLQKLLPGYYMNLSQNPRTLLPKFFGLYCFHYNSKNVRLVAMNNLLPSDIKMHAKYDLKGSTFRRKASKIERQKANPVFKDLDFMEHHPNGIFLETDTYSALMKTIQRDCMVLESFQIMDYSLLVGIHNLDIAAKEKREERIRNARAKLQRIEELRQEQTGVGVSDAPEADQAQITSYNMPTVASSSSMAGAGTSLNRSRSINRQRLVAHSTAMESITADMDVTIDEDDDVPAGGIPARSENDERLILYIGIIDILQSYRLEKKLEHTFKSIIYNGDTVSVCRPSFYAQRFQNFMGKTVFKKTPTFPLKHSPSKRKTSTVTMRTPHRTPSQTMPRQNTHTMLSGMSTPPPAFDDISEEDLTANSSATLPTQRSSYLTSGGTSGTGTGVMLTSNALDNAARFYMPQRTRSYVSSSNRSVLSSDYSDDESNSVSEARSPYRTTKLTKTNVHVTTVGCLEDGDGDEGVGVDSDSKENSATEAQQQQQRQSQQQQQQLLKQNDVHIEQYDANGKPIMATTKTTIIKATAQTYTTTLVVNDVTR